MLENWRTQVERIETATGYRFHRKTVAVQQGVGSFLGSSLRHQAHLPEDVRHSTQVSDRVREAFEIFEQWVNGVEAPADHEKLDSLPARLDGAAGRLAPFVQALERGQRPGLSDRRA